MFANIARGAFLLFLAFMIASWAMTVSKSSPLEDQPGPVTYYAFC